MPDAHKNFAYSTILTAPSPATSGTSLVLASGDGTKFPAVSFNATVWPAGVQPLTTNSEIIRVTTIATDTLTITRAQESTSARSILVGDQIAATITAKTLTDIEGMALVRSVQTLTSSITLGAVAGTDYVIVLGTGGVPTMPTAVGNTNLYTIKNNTVANVTIATTSSQTIDGTTTIVLSPYSSVDLISNNINWFVI